MGVEGFLAGVLFVFCVCLKSWVFGVELFACLEAGLAFYLFFFKGPGLDGDLLAVPGGGCSACFRGEGAVERLVRGVLSCVFFCTVFELFRMDGVGFVVFGGGFAGLGSNGSTCTAKRGTVVCQAGRRGGRSRKFEGGLKDDRGGRRRPTRVGELYRRELSLIVREMVANAPRSAGM